MIYSGHQISFLPWVGFWNKVVLSNVFDVAIYHQFTKRTWQHYSFIGSNIKKVHWGLELRDDFRHKSYLYKLNEIKVKKFFSKRLLEEFEYTHQKDKYFKEIFPLLKEWLEEVDKLDSLWLINLILLEKVKTLLNIETPFIISPPDIEATPTLNIIKNSFRCNCDTYLSGPHGINYLNKSEFKAKNINLIFQNTEFLYKEYPLSIFSTISIFGIKETLRIVHEKY